MIHISGGRNALAFLVCQPQSDTRVQLRESYAVFDEKLIRILMYHGLSSNCLYVREYTQYNKRQEVWFLDMFLAYS